MIQHAGFLDQIGLPWGVHLRIVIRSSRNARADNVSLIFQTKIDERGISLRCVILQVGGAVAFPQQETHRYFTLEFVCCAAKTFKRECLKNHLTIGIAYIYFIVLIERFSITRFRNNVPTKFVQFIVNTLFKVRRCCSDSIVFPY